MAVLYPEIEVIRRLKVQPTEGEWTLLSFLIESLDDTYEIYFQPYLNGDNPDLVIMRKGSGVLIIEVKDWNLSHYSCDQGNSWRLLKDRRLIKSPLDQVKAYKNNLFQLHLEKLHENSTKNSKYRAVVACAVYFHNASMSELTNFLSLKNKDDKSVGQPIVLGRDSLNSKSLDSLLLKSWLGKRSYFFDDILYNSFCRYLSPPMHQLEEGIQIIYTKEQKELIRSEVRPRRKIKGVAGCGKTLVLAKRAVNAHIRTGGRVLVLTYNLSLKNYIHDRISDVRESFCWSYFYITNYHQFFKAQANNYNLEITGIDNWQNSFFFESKKDDIAKFDVVLIDEIQDYEQSWIDIITKYFTHSETEFVVFGDEKQNIYSRELDKNNEPIVRTIPGGWNKSLKTSHRLSITIGNIAIKFQKEFFNKKYTLDEINFTGQLDFSKRIIEYHYFKASSSQVLLNEVYKVLERNRIHSSDVGILCSRVELLREVDFLIRTVKKEKTATTFESQEEYEKLMNKNNGKEIERKENFRTKKSRLDEMRRFKKNHFWMKTGTIKLSTVHSFKGWEIDTLFLIIEPEKSEDKFTNAELIYTALTRAKRNLIVFNLENLKYDQFFKQEIQDCFLH